MAGIASSHSGAGAKLRVAKRSVETTELVSDKAIVKVDVVGDENTVTHELKKAVSHRRENRGVANHLVRDAREPHDICRNGTLGIEQGVPLVDDLMIADLDRANLCNAVARGPAPGCLDI